MTTIITDSLDRRRTRSRGETAQSTASFFPTNTSYHATTLLEDPQSQAGGSQGHGRNRTLTSQSLFGIFAGLSEFNPYFLDWNFNQKGKRTPSAGGGIVGGNGPAVNASAGPGIPGPPGSECQHGNTSSGDITGPSAGGPGTIALHRRSRTYSIPVHLGDLAAIREDGEGRNAPDSRLLTTHVQGEVLMSIHRDYAIGDLDKYRFKRPLDSFGNVPLSRLLQTIDTVNRILAVSFDEKSVGWRGMLGCLLGWAFDPTTQAGYFQQVSDFIRRENDEYYHKHHRAHLLDPSYTLYESLSYLNLE